MAETTPMPAFYFSVSGIPGNPVFESITGLDFEVDVIEYRAGNSVVAAPMKMPGLTRVSNVTMRKGIFTSDNTLWSWISQITMGTVPRCTIVVNLLDQAGAPKHVWTLNNAFPVALRGTELKAGSSEVAVESVEIAYETLVVSAP